MPFMRLVAAVVVLGLGLLGACASDGDVSSGSSVQREVAPVAAEVTVEESEPETTPVETDAPTTEPATVTTVAVTTTTVAPTTTTAMPTTTTEAATTTTVDPAVEADVKVLLLGTNITADKPKLAGIITDASHLVESADLINFEVQNGPPPAASLVIAVTGVIADDVEYQDEAMWDLARVLATFWSGDSAFRNEVGTVRPNLVLTIDSLTYVAPMELMMQVADLNVTSTDFLNATRQ